MSMNRFPAFLFGGLSIVLASSAAAASNSTYISLGDSIGYGVTTFADAAIPSFGDKGYVKPYADFLKTQNGGVRPNVFNLAIPGESSGSFFDNTQIYRALNLNYFGSTQSQSQKFAATVASELGAGHTISTVSVSIGPDDLFALTDQPGFFDLPLIQQQALIQSTLAQLQTNYALLLTQVRTLTPAADLIIVGDYNPYAIVPTSPYFGLAPTVIGAINQIASGLAGAFSGRYIDTYSAFVGHEAEYTHILDDSKPGDNEHPNDLGYQVIANLMVPAPGTSIVMVAGLVGISRRRR